MESHKFAFFGAKNQMRHFWTIFNFINFDQFWRENSKRISENKIAKNEKKQD